MADEEHTLAQAAVARFVQFDSDKAALGATRLDPIPDDLPPAVHDCFHHYAQVACEFDFSTSVHRLRFGPGELYVILLIPDGNDGWFEAYTAAGGLVGAGQFVLEKVAWADVA